MVAVGLMSNFIGTGIGFYAFGVFFKPLAQHFGWSRAMVGWGPGVGLIAASMFAPLIGRSADRQGMRPLLIRGGIGVAITLFALSFIQSYWQFLLLWGVIYCVFNAHLGDIVTGPAVARSFSDKRGAALGIASIGVSFGGVAMPPIAQYLIHHWDFRIGFRGMSCMALLFVLLPALFFLKRSGMASSTETPAPPKSSNPVIEKSYTRSEALASSRFWKLVVTFGLGYLPLGTMLVQQVPFLTDMGITPLRAAWVLSFTAMMGMTGKVLWGSLFDYIEGRWTIIGSYAMQAFAVFWLLRADSFGDAMIFGLFFGLGMGGTVPMHTAMRARQFGAENLGAIMGISSPAIMLTQAGGQPLAGWIFDTTGSYNAAFYFFIACYLIGMLVVMTLRDPKRENVVLKQ